MRTRNALIVITIALITIAFSGISTAAPSEAGNKVVSVADYGAKDFVAPVPVQLQASTKVIATQGTGDIKVGDTIRIINGDAERRSHKVRLTVHSMPTKPIKVLFSLYYSSSGRYDIKPTDSIKSLVDKIMADTRLNQYWKFTRIADDTIEAESKGENDLTQKTASQFYGIAAYQAGETYDGTWTMTILQTGSSGLDLTARVMAIDDNTMTLDKSSRTTATSTAYIDSTKAFRDAFTYANSNGYDVFIPAGKYFVDSDVIVQTNVKSLGQIFTSNKGTSPLFVFPRKEKGITLTGYSLAGSLAKGTKLIPELAAYPNYDVIFDSTERIMWRNNNAKEFYPKREANRVAADGSLVAGLMESYTDKSLLTLTLFKQEQPIRVEGLNILCIDNTITQRGKTIISVRRSDVVFDNLTLDNENLSTKEGQNTGIGIADAAEVQINNGKIRGFMLDGYGYPILVSRTLYVRLNNTEVSYARHAVAGNADRFTIINGGSYEGYSGTLDSHWGHDFIVDGALVKGPITYAGENFSINNSTLITSTTTLVARRSDTPSISGDFVIKNSKIIYTGGSEFSFYRVQQTDFKHEAELYNPNLILENVQLELDYDIRTVNLYEVSNDTSRSWVNQVLPEVIQVKNLTIAGKNGQKLANTCLNAQVQSGASYTGKPVVTLTDVHVNSSSTTCPF